MTARSRHVIANSRGGWSVRSYGAARATRTFADLESAEKFGRELAAKEQVDLYIHARDGSVNEKTHFAPAHDA